MTQKNSQKHITQINKKSLNRLIRTIQLSEGQFSLILAHCNYSGLHRKISEDLKSLSSASIWEINLPVSAQTLYTFVMTETQGKPPDAVIVSGLEHAQALDNILISANRVREEFRKNFTFPMILWVNDPVLDRLARFAPDFKSWSGSHIRFEPCDDDLSDALHQSADRLFREIKESDDLSGVYDPELFLKSFLQDIKDRNPDLEPAMKADLQFLLGKSAQNKQQADSAISFYEQSLDLRKHGDLERQAVLRNAIACCYEIKGDLEKAESHFQVCAEIFGQDLPVRFAKDLCRVLREQEKWDELEKAGEELSQGDYLALARAHNGKDEARKAIENLKNAAGQDVSESDPKLSIGILELLHDLYFEQEEYLEAFQAKQDRLSLEQQYGFRAFVGAGRLKARRHSHSKESDVTQEIQASVRQFDVDRLISRISRTDCKLIVLHGHSGVGKSSILEAGLEPALRQKRIATRDILPILIRSYTDWVKNTFPFPLLGKHRETTGILAELQKNDERNLLTVLIFDQFEEFFFANPEPAGRRKFYAFLRDCLNMPFVKVILSLREDYLHFLLECERIANLEMISNDILNKNIRYYVGNFTPEDARSVIINLTEHAHFHLENRLIDRFVNDLAKETGEVRPIELQVVGSQLQAENITTLERYKCKEELVAGFLKEVIIDCGKENEEATLMILYLLTDENNTRPLKTRYEISNELKNTDFRAQDEQLELILEILMGSGLIFFAPEKPADRYQIVHDYLVTFIRSEAEKMIAEKQKLQEKERELEALNASSNTLFVLNDELSALVEGVKAAKILKQTNMPIKLKNQTVLNLWEIVYSIREKNRLQQDDSPIHSVNFSPDGKILASGSEDSTIKLWDTVTGCLINVLKGHSNFVNSVNFSPDGKILASASRDNTIKLWNVEDGIEIRTLRGHDENVYSVSFSPDGMFLASGSRDNTIKLWNIEDDDEINTLKGYYNRVIFSPDGKILASGNWDKIKLLNVEDGSEINTLKGHFDNVFSLDFSPDGKILASGSRDNTIKLWNMKDGSEIITLKGHSNYIRSVNFSPDGKILASGSTDRTIKLWNIEDGSEIKTLKGHYSSVYCLSFSPHGKILASGSFDRTIRLWDIEDSSEISTLKSHSNYVRSVNFSPDGKMLASGSYDCTIKLWNIDDCSENKTLIGHSDNVYSVRFSSDGKMLASGSWDNTIKLWNMEDGCEIRTLRGHTDSVYSVSFSSDDKILASASRDNTIRLWNVEDGCEIKILKGHSRVIRSVSFSSDGKILASGSWDNTIKLWSVEDGCEIKTLRGHSDNVFGVDFSPDGKILASGSWDNTIKIWNVEDGCEIKTLKGHSKGVRSVNFSPNGKVLASGGWDNTIKIWNVEDGCEIKTLKGHTNYVISINFSPDGKMLASGSDDTTVKLWNLTRFQDINLDDLLLKGCNWLYNYLKTNPNVSEEDRCLCDDILSESQMPVYKNMVGS